jgi:hypothetical protein
LMAECVIRDRVENRTGGSLRWEKGVKDLKGLRVRLRLALSAAVSSALRHVLRPCRGTPLIRDDKDRIRRISLLDWEETGAVPGWE